MYFYASTEYCDTCTAYYRRIVCEHCYSYVRRYGRWSRPSCYRRGCYFARASSSSSSSSSYRYRQRYYY
ncbi:hypothetical protein P8C59_002747 [Phyllachora maydis]|uniref:Uncharacterized protein n=1 Tax=Phyllachora maydis TaxID=1825666 RepID=A0AAD9HYU1_9PEZI|nr:hypothetical protein P8C59_002747 [Phyllachora maydis]